MPPTTLSGAPVRRPRTNDDTELFLSKIQGRMVKTTEGLASALFESSLFEGALRDFWSARNNALNSSPAVLNQERIGDFLVSFRSQPGRDGRYSQDPRYIYEERARALLRDVGQYCQGRSGDGQLVLHAPGDGCRHCHTRRDAKPQLPKVKELPCECGVPLAPGADECYNCCTPRAEVEAKALAVTLAAAEEATCSPAALTKQALQKLRGTAAEMTATAIMLKAGLIVDAVVVGKCGDGGCDIEAWVPQRDDQGNLVRDANGNYVQDHRVLVQAKGGKTPPSPAFIREVAGSNYVAAGWKPWLVAFGDRTQNTDVQAHGNVVPVRVLDGHDLAELALRHNVTIPDDEAAAQQLLESLGGVRA